MQALRIALIIAFASALVACASPTPRSAASLNAQANQAYFSGKYSVALEGFEAARNAAKVTSDAQYEAIATFGMARANVQLCKFSAATELFQKSIQLRSAIPDIRFAKVTQNLVEYARFLLSVNRPLEALPLMEQAIPDLEISGIANTDPIAYAEFFDDYSVALKAAGRDSNGAIAKAAQLRSNNPGRTAQFRPTPLPSQCMKK